MKNNKRYSFGVLGLVGVVTVLLITIIHSSAVQGNISDSVSAQGIQNHLPLAQPHPLPEQLMLWSGGEQEEGGDYFNLIQPTILGYLVWSHFPVQIYLDLQPEQSGQTRDNSEAWVMAVQSAIDEWNHYIPLELTSSSEEADITIVAQTPPLRWSEERNFASNHRVALGQEAIATNRNPKYLMNWPTLDFSSIHSQIIDSLHGQRAQTAETTYAFDVVTLDDGCPMILQRYHISISPNQSSAYLAATARHELGHALGVWGHSPSEADALYRSQVRNPAPISVRDINTLKKIYQQPTQLGWPLLTP